MDLTCARKFDFYLFDLTRNRAKACCKTWFPAESQGFQADLRAILQDRSDLKNGIKVDSCLHCWKLEEKNFQSFRTIQVFSDRSITPDEHSPYLVELLVGTQCNLKCIYCGPQSSSMWEKGRKHLDPNHSPIPNDILNFLERKWESIGVFNLVGGEPVLTPLTKDVLDLLLNLSKQYPTKRKKRLKIVSNLAVPTSEFKKFLDRLRTISELIDVEIGVSAESMSQRFEYIRDGALYKTFENNLKNLMQHRDIDVTLQSTLNVLAMPKFHEFLIDFIDCVRMAGKTVHLNFNEVVWPTELSPRNYPVVLKEEKKLAFEALSKIHPNEIRHHGRFHEFRDSLSKLYDSLGQGSLRDTIGFLNRSENQRLRKLRWQEVFPEIAELSLNETLK